MKTRTILVLIAACCVTLTSVYAWHRIHSTAEGTMLELDKTVGAVVTVTPPLGLPPVPVPDNNPITAEKVALGRTLFYDKRLSSDNTVSCSSCHNPLLGFTDGASHSTGVAGKTGKRNAISILNAAYDPLQFWDGRAPTLEAQVGTPMEDPNEMNQPHAITVTKLEKDPAVQGQFDAAFGPGPITIEKIQQALASFERMLISGNSAFDRY